MGYSRFSTRFRRRGFKKVAVVVKPKNTIMKNKGLGKKSVEKICKTLISRNIENKKTTAAQAVAPVCQFSTAGVPTWYVLKNWNTNVWKVGQSSLNAGRVGNHIKMKKWIIKGQIIPDAAGISFNDSTGYLKQSYQGYLTLFFGRRTDTDEVPSALTALFDSGNSTFSPVGSSTEMMLPINKELYKIYWRKTFKLGAAYGPNASTTQSPNNDFNLTRTFGFDVCKYIMKNRILKYNDVSDSPSDRDLTRLAIWAIWRPAIGSLSNPNLFTTNSFYNINLTSYGEYEDA